MSCVFLFFFYTFNLLCLFFFFFQAEDGIRDRTVTGVQTCALPICTADRRRTAPTPTIDPVMACVVLTGTPNCVAVRSAMAAPVSAAKPPTGWSLVIFEPIVWMMRQPPDSVPRPMAVCAARITHTGIEKVLR